MYHAISWMRLSVKERMKAMRKLAVKKKAPAKKKRVPAKSVSKKVKKTPKKKAKKAQDRPHEFPLSLVLEKNPCIGGFQRAVQFLREKSALIMPAAITEEFWRLLPSHNPDHRQRLNQLSRQVRVRILPDVFRDAIVSDYNFRDYSVRILGKKGRSIWKKNIDKKTRDLFKKEAQKEKLTEIKEYIEELEGEITALQQSIVQSKAELKRQKATLTKTKAKKLSNCDFNPHEVFHADSVQMKNGVAAALVVAMQQSIPSRSAA